MYLLKSKNEAMEKFVLYKSGVENELNNDQGGEYELPFVDFWTQHGIIHEATTPYSPQSNRVVERKN